MLIHLQDEIAWFRNLETLRKYETLCFRSVSAQWKHVIHFFLGPIMFPLWFLNGNMTTCFRCIFVNGILSLPVSVTFPCTDSNRHYRQVKHIYKVLYNSCTTLPWSLDRSRTTEANWRALGAYVRRNYVKSKKLRCFTLSHVHVNFEALSKTCSVLSFLSSWIIWDSLVT